MMTPGRLKAKTQHDTILVATKRLLNCGGKLFLKVLDL